MDIVDRLQHDRPPFHVGGTVRWDSLPETLRMIDNSVHEGDRTLEVGCGASTVVFAAHSSHHTVISPDADEHKRVKEYCGTVGIDDSRLEFIVGLSDDVLPSICRDRILDVAFIDGAHSFPFPEVDWHYVTRAMKIGGRLLIDDVPVPAVAPLYRHMTLEPNWKFEGILDHRAAAFTLVGLPAPEEGAGQPFNRTYPDYSFAAPALRTRLVAAHRSAQLKREVARRYPHLRDAYRRISPRPQ